MQISNRRKFLLSLAVCLISATVVVGTVVADELLGVLTKVDVEGKKITVVPKDAEDKEVVVTITDKTEQVSKKKNGETVTKALDLEKLDDYVKKVQEKGAKGLNVKVTHEKAVASKIEVEKRKKKAAAAE